MGFGSSVMGEASGVSPTVANYDGKGTYLIFNVGDVIFINDFNSPNKEPINFIHFSSSNLMCHSFDADAKEEHDTVIGFNSGDEYTVSLRHQLQDTSRKLVGAQHYNKEGVINNRLLPFCFICLMSRKEEKPCFFTRMNQTRILDMITSNAFV